MNAPPTPRQAEAFRFIQIYIGEHGYAPTYDEIGQRMDINKISAREHVLGLIRKEYIKKVGRPYSTRGIVLATDACLPEPVTCMDEIDRYIPVRPAKMEGLDAAAIGISGHKGSKEHGVLYDCGRIIDIKCSHGMTPEEASDWLDSLVISTSDYHFPPVFVHIFTSCTPSTSQQV